MTKSLIMTNTKRSEIFIIQTIDVHDKCRKKFV